MKSTSSRTSHFSKKKKNQILTKKMYLQVHIFDIIAYIHLNNTGNSLK